MLRRDTFRLWRTQIVDKRSSLLAAPFGGLLLLYAFGGKREREYQYAQWDPLPFPSLSLRRLSFLISISRTYRLGLIIHERQKKIHRWKMCVRTSARAQVNLLSIDRDRQFYSRPICFFLVLALLDLLHPSCSFVRSFVARQYQFMLDCFFDDDEEKQRRRRLARWRTELKKEKVTCRDDSVSRRFSLT